MSDDDKEKPKFVAYTYSTGISSPVYLVCAACGLLVTIGMAGMFFYEIVRRDPVSGVIGIGLGLVVGACIIVPVLMWAFRKD